MKADENGGTYIVHVQIRNAYKTVVVKRGDLGDIGVDGIIIKIYLKDI
jgi:hypothetical protein